MQLFSDTPPLSMFDDHLSLDEDEVEGEGGSKSIGGVNLFRTAIQLTITGVGLWYLYDTFASLSERYRLIVMIMVALVLSWIGYKIYELLGKPIADFLGDAVPWF